MATPRSVQREGMPETVRTRLLEGDIDTMERSISELARQVEQVGKDVAARLGKIQWAIISLLISIITGVVVFIVTLRTGGHV